jgi:RHS repeat-associated protein
VSFADAAIEDQVWGSGREGLHALRVGPGGSYHRTVTGLDPSKKYLFSIWKNPGTGWTREVRRTLAPAGDGSLTIEVNSQGLYDQAELIEDRGQPMPESWIPENRLGRVDWFVTDHLGSTKLLIDQNGQHRFTGDDDPFGINLRQFGDKDSHRYTGQILDEEQGLYYYGARYYLPEIGRFLSGDPEQHNHSPYIYANNNPLKFIDITGNRPEDPEFQSVFRGQNLTVVSEIKWLNSNDYHRQEIVTERRRGSVSYGSSPAAYTDPFWAGGKPVVVQGKDGLATGLQFNLPSGGTSLKPDLTLSANVYINKDSMNYFGDREAHEKGHVRLLYRLYKLAGEYKDLADRGVSSINKESDPIKRNNLVQMQKGLLENKLKQMENATALDQGAYHGWLYKIFGYSGSSLPAPQSPATDSSK